jgi:hypothetical protein
VPSISVTLRITILLKRALALTRFSRGAALSPPFPPRPPCARRATCPSGEGANVNAPTSDHRRTNHCSLHYQTSQDHEKTRGLL